MPQITRNLTTPATSDPDLKSSIHSAHNNSKTLELLNKSSVVDFTIHEILTELVYESEIHNGSILLFPPRFKQEVSLSHPIEGKKYAPRRILRKSLSRKDLFHRKKEDCILHKQDGKIQ